MVEKIVENHSVGNGSVNVPLCDDLVCGFSVLVLKCSGAAQGGPLVLGGLLIFIFKRCKGAGLIELFNFLPHFFLIFFYIPFWCWCFYLHSLHWLGESVSPVCGLFFKGLER